jgi:hypothetical protein
MKTFKHFTSFLFAALFITLFTSCDPIVDPINLNDVTISTGLYVLNEGSFNGNNASLTYFDFSTQLPTNDIFKAKNNRGLGDTGQDILKYGSNIYIAISKSSLIEVIDAKTAVSKKSISMVNASNVPSQPRSLAAIDGKVYITLYDGHVAQLDTTTLTITKTITVGTNPEGCAIANNKLYVANSGGIQAKADSTISVIDLSTFTETKKIKVVMNPVVLKADKYGNVYVISMGNYSSIPYTFQRINGINDTVTAIPQIKAYNMTIDDNKAYLYYFDYDANYNIQNKTYSIYDIENQQLITNAFIPSTALSNAPYGIGVDPVTKDVFIGETDYLNTGRVSCFSNTGVLKYSFEVGMNPGKMIFITNK